jgi:hypothetical protein
MEDTYTPCHLCGKLVRYEDDVIIDESELEHECDGSEDVE